MAYITKKTTVNGVKPIGSNLYGTCSTASDTAQKTVAMADFDVLVSGVTIHVYFTHKNTASNPTLKVGSTSAVAIKRNGATDGKWKDGSVISFTYDGTNWVQNDADDDGATYTLSKNGGNITLTGSDGSSSSVTVEEETYPHISDVDYTANSYMAFNVGNRTSRTGGGSYNVTVKGVGKIERDGDDLKIYNYEPTGHASASESIQTIPLTADNVFFANFLTTLGEICDAVNDGKQVWLKLEIPLPPSQSRTLYQYTPLAELDCSSYAMFYDIDHFDATDITQITIWTVDDTNGWTHKYIPIESGGVSDVQVNGTSVVTNNVANIAPSDLIDIFYPVGSYYETSDANFDPNIAWGGTWHSEVVTDDEVIEEVNSSNGTTSGWSYRKWKSGISECWGRTVATNYAITNAYGNGYYFLKNPIATFPSIFTSPPIVNITRTNISGGSGLIFASIYATTATSCSAYVFDSKSDTTSLQFSMYARGLWKTYTAPTNIYRWHRTA